MSKAAARIEETMARFDLFENLSICGMPSEDKPEK